MMDQELRCRCSSGAQCQYHQNTFQTTVPLHKYAKNELNCWRDDRRSGLVNVSNDGVAWEFARWWMGSNININAQGITKFIAWDQQWSEELQDRWWSDQQILGTLHICRRHQDFWDENIANCLSSEIWEEILRNGYYTHMHIAVLLLFYFCIHPPFQLFFNLPFFSSTQIYVVLHCTIFLLTFYSVWKGPISWNVSDGLQYTAVEWKGCSGRNRTFFHPLAALHVCIFLCIRTFFLGQKSRKVGHVLFMHLGFLSS